MTVLRRSLVIAGGGASLIAVGLWPKRAPATTWPAITRIVLPTSPGGGLDLMARALGDELGRQLGSHVLIEHRPGASGLLAARAAVQAPADGSTALYVHAGHVTLQALGARLDLLRQFRLVATFHASPHVLAVAAATPWQRFTDLLESLRTRADGLTFGSGGTASPSHLIVERLLQALAEGTTRPLHVPYKSPTEAVMALSAGVVDFGGAFAGTVMALAGGGRVRALAVSARARLEQFPDLPTIAEAGLLGFTDEVWGGLALPAGASDALVARLDAAVRAATGVATLRGAIARVGGVVQMMDSPQAFESLVRRDLEADRTLGKRLGLRLE
jgi:tripartite-type tricarboxylate transporter receptor subunit TctC